MLSLNFDTRVVPAIEGLNLQASTLREIVKDLQPKGKTTKPVKELLHMATQRLLIKYATQVEVISYHQPSDPTKTVLDAFEYCLKMKCPEASATILTRFLDARKMEGGYVRSYCGPLLHDVGPLLHKHKARVSSPEFAPVFRKVILDWVDKVLGPKPADAVPVQLRNIGTWRCDCPDCPAVRQFLTSDPEQTKTFHGLGAPRRTHVEKFLRNHAMTLAEWSTVQSRPQGLLVRHVPSEPATLI